ncbi:MAG: dihydrofolate reductase [Candidatus Campbellbacteria bacterium]|nr:dihydrofolate reductase [Candidatus Campbellbacteria bacterium]
MNRIHMIVAHNERRVIGFKGKTPWHLSADLKRFKEVTLGHTVVMGRKTANSIEKPLPNRTNVVMSRSPYSQSGFEWVSSEEGVSKFLGNKPIFIIGGEQIYKLFLPFCDKLYRTVIDADVEGDAFFPEIRQNEWELVENIPHPIDEKNKNEMVFQALKRKWL